MNRLALIVLFSSAAIAAAGMASAKVSASGPGAAAHRHYDAHESQELVPLLAAVLHFDTIEGHTDALAKQRAWVLEAGRKLGLTVRDAGPVTEVELPGPPGAPVLGLVVHGDVQPVESAGWSQPPFGGVVKDGMIHGRGAADDKGPLVQALLAMHAIKEAVPLRTHTIRLLVGSDEESNNLDIKTYLLTHAAPDYSLVLDSAFPVVVGEKAWNALILAAPPDAAPRPGAERFPYSVESATAGLAASIVPDKARVVLHWNSGAPDWQPLVARLSARKPDKGTTLEFHPYGERLTISAAGRAAHGGVNIEGGRNALVSLARVVDGELPPCGLADLLAFALLAGEDLKGTGLGLTEETPVWGRYSVNVATLGEAHKLLAVPGHEKEPTLVINLRRPPPLTAAQLKERMDALVAAFNTRTGAHLVPGGYYADEPFGVPPDCKLVRRLMQDYSRVTGESPPPAISGGGTYAKRLPHALAFGMWFPDKPYPGHDTDERVEIADLQKGAHVLIEALADLGTGPKLEQPFAP
jgi:predicted dipeptidase